MQTRREIIAQLDRDYQMRAEDARTAAARAAEALERELPEYAQLDADRRRLTLRLGRALIEEKPTEALRAELAELDRIAEALLQANAVNPDTLRPHYVCDICHDTGRTPEGGICACYKRELLERLCRDICVDGEGSFDTFDLGVFPEGEQRDYMEKLLRFARDYAETFPTSQHFCLTLCGEAGLGKTFTVNCMARRVLERGYSVARLTAFGLMEELRDEHLGKSERNLLSDLREADLLVIDDLGTEPFYNNITLEYLFSLLNERRMSHRHTILSTNLTPSGLREHYGERIYSRLAETTYGVVLQLTGTDIRTRRK